MDMFIIGILGTALFFTVRQLRNQKSDNQPDNHQTTITLSPYYTKINCTVVNESLRNAAKLITFEERYNNKMEMDKVRFFFFHKRMKVRYFGHIAGGFDLTKAKAVETSEGIRIILPEPEIFCNEIYDRDTLLKENSLLEDITEEDCNNLEERGKREYEAKIRFRLQESGASSEVTGKINAMLGMMRSYSVEPEGAPICQERGYTERPDRFQKLLVRLPYRNEDCDISPKRLGWDRKALPYRNDDSNYRRY